MPPTFNQPLSARLPADTTNTAPASSSNCISGNGVGRCCGLPLGRIRNVKAAYSTMIGNRIPNAQRQAFNSAKIPPTAGPTNVAIPHIAEISAMARGQSFCSNTRLIIA
ncbi:hypothetical protein D3C80_1599660 [compost metagenome]